MCVKSQGEITISWNGQQFTKKKTVSIATWDSEWLIQCNKALSQGIRLTGGFNFTSRSRLTLQTSFDSTAVMKFRVIVSVSSIIGLRRARPIAEKKDDR